MAYRGVLPGLLLDRLALGLQDLKSGFWEGYNGDYVSYWWERQSRKPAQYRCRLGRILLKMAAILPLAGPRNLIEEAIALLLRLLPAELRGQVRGVESWGHAREQSATRQR